VARPRNQRLKGSEGHQGCQWQGQRQRKKVAKVESDDVNGGDKIIEGEEYEVKAKMSRSAGSGSSSDGEGCKGEDGAE
jgi:hypothetical protein